MNRLNKILSGIVMILAIGCAVVYLWNNPNNDIQATSSQTSEPATAPTSAPTISPSGTEKQYTIGWSVYTTDFEFFQSMQEGVLAKAEELGFHVLTHDQKRSTAEMITGSLNLINQGIDALVISPYDPEAISIVADAANNAGIPIVVIDQGYDNATINAFIVSDSFAGGIWAGEYALQLIKKYCLTSKNAAIIKVEEKYPYARLRGEGFKSALNDYGYNIIEKSLDNSISSEAYIATKDILANYGDDLAVIFSETDRMALGAAQAINEAGKKGQILVIGFDGDQAAIDAIKEGSMQGTIAQQPYGMGELGVEVAYKLLNSIRVNYDNRLKKELLMEVYLIDETGTVIKK